MWKATCNWIFKIPFLLALNPFISSVSLSCFHSLTCSFSLSLPSPSPLLSTVNKPGMLLFDEHSSTPSLSFPMYLLKHRLLLRWRQVIYSSTVKFRKGWLIILRYFLKYCFQLLESHFHIKQTWCLHSRLTPPLYTVIKF